MVKTRESPALDKARDRAARRSGHFGADKPGYDKPSPERRRDADKRPNRAGPEFEEGGQYPGLRRPGDERKD